MLTASFFNPLAYGLRNDQIAKKSGSSKNKTDLNQG